MTYIYLNYSQKDNEILQLISHDLEDANHTIWKTDTDDESQSTNKTDIDVITNAYTMIIAHSKNSVSSSKINNRHNVAINLQIPIVVLLLDRTPISDEMKSHECVQFEDFGRYNGIDLINHYKRAFDQLSTILNKLRPFSKYLYELEDADDKIREKAAQKLGEIGDVRAGKPLLKALEDEDVGVRFYVAHALGELKVEAALGPLIRRLKGDSDPDVRAISALALGKIDRPEGIGPLIDVLTARDRFIREAAVNALGYLMAKEAVPDLVNLLRSDSISDVREAAKEALEKIATYEAKKALNKEKLIRKYFRSIQYYLQDALKLKDASKTMPEA